MENLCYDRVIEILEKIRPKKILVLGFGTYRRLKKYIVDDIPKEKSITGFTNRKLVYLSSWNKIPIFCMIHPTGNRINQKDWIKIKSKLYTFLDE